MRATEIIRGVLDIIDSLDNPTQAVSEPVEQEPQDANADIYDDDLNRMKMIAGVLPDPAPVMSNAVCMASNTTLLCPMPK